MSNNIELSEKDQRRMNKIQWRKAGNGKYFSFYDSKEKAYLKLKELASRYRHSGLHTNTIKDLVEEYQQEGIMMYRPQVQKWLPEVFNIEVKKTGVHPKDKITTTITLNRTLKTQYLDALTGENVSQHKRSWYINTLLMKHAGMDTEEVLVFFEGQRIDPETKQYEAQTISALFFEEKGEVRCLYFGKLQNETKKIAELLAQVGEDEGLERLARRAERLGYFVI